MSYIVPPYSRAALRLLKQTASLLYFSSINGYWYLTITKKHSLSLNINIVSFHRGQFSVVAQ